MQAENDDDAACDLGQQIRMARDRLPYERCGRAEGSEHDREAQDEHQRRQQHPALDAGLGSLALGQLLEGDAADEAEIGRHKRQHAGAEEAQDAGEERARIGNLEPRHRWRGHIMNLDLCGQARRFAPKSCSLMLLSTSRRALENLGAYHRSGYMR